MRTMQQMFLQLFQVSENQDLTKYSLHPEAEDVVDHLRRLPQMWRLSIILRRDSGGWYYQQGCGKYAW